MELNLLVIFFAAIFTHNLALTYILGMCPIFGLSNNVKSATGMGIAVIFVVTLTAIINWPIYNLILVPLKSTIISYVIFIIVIAGTVQLVEMVMDRFFPVLQSIFGIFLPLITVNCTVLSISLFMTIRNYDFLETFVFALGSSVGWALALLLITFIKNKVSLNSDVPEGLRGAGITMIIAAILSMAFMGFAGMLDVK